MPCWTGEGGWTQAARPICVCHFGHCKRDARSQVCKSSPLPTLSCRVLCSWSIPGSAKPAVYQYGVFFWPFIPLCLGPWWNAALKQEWRWASTAADGWRAWAGTTPLALAPSPELRWHQRFSWHWAGCRFAALRRSKKQTRGLPGLGSIWDNGTVVVNTGTQHPDAGVRLPCRSPALSRGKGNRLFAE